ncbi:MAG: right-handed parallel beta-helix repeat-containing protein [Phycisphaerae bacterium]
MHYGEWVRQLLIISVAVVGIVGSSAFAANVHVSPKGDDVNPGTRQEPLRTLSRAAEMLKPGDVCIIAGGVYRETVTPAASGDRGDSIIFRAAAGQKVVISGIEPLDGWEKKGEVFEAKSAGRFDQLFVDGEMMTLARFPNRGKDRFKPEKLEVTVDGKTAEIEKRQGSQTDWTGATLWAMGGRGWVAGTAEVAGSDNGRLTLKSKIPFFSKGTGTGYLEGHPAALDAPGEWVHTDRTVRLIPPKGVDPRKVQVQTTRRRWGFDLSGRKHIRIEGIRFFATSVNTDKADGCVIDRCRFEWPSWRRDIRGGFNRDKGISIESGGLGVVLGGEKNVLSSSILSRGVGDGVSVYGRNNRVENCIIHDFNTSASDCAPVDLTGEGHTVTKCTIYNAGRSGVLHRKLKKGTITYNHIYNIGLMTNDLGGTYCFTTDGAGTEIAYNRIHDVHCKTGVGIYIDNFSKNFLIHHNVIYDTKDSGIRLNTPANSLTVAFNTLARTGNAMNYWGDKGNKDMAGVVVVNNILPGMVRLGDGVKKHHNYTDDSPGFADADENDFTLEKGSPCIDAGVKIDGVRARVVGDAPDIGCYEKGVEPWEAGSSLKR